MNNIFKHAWAIGALALSATLLVSCDDIYDNQTVPAPGVPAAIVSTSISDGQKVDPAAVTNISINFDKDVAINPAVSITLNDVALAPAHATDDLGNIDRKTVNIPLSLTPNTEYELVVPERAFTGIGTAAWSKGFTLNFSTGIPGEDPETPIVADIDPINNANATAQAKNIYQYLVDNYGKTMLTGAMGEVGWSLQYSDFINQQTGKYPAIVGFDYIHLCWSAPNSWINYADITPVKTIWDAGSIPAMSWHWNVPTKAPGESITVWEGETAMGTWSNYIQLVDEASMAAFASAKVGDVIIVEVSELGSNPQGSFKDGSTWSQIAEGTEWFAITGNFSLTITQPILDALTTHGLVVSGQNYTATKVTIGAGGGTGGGDYSFYNTINDATTDFSAANVLVDGTWENSVALADVEKLAQYIQLLQDAGIAILWRPFHEAAGDYSWGPWFWWGNSGVEVTKQLYIWLHDKLTNVYGLNNLIWVWTMQTSDAGKLASYEQIQAAYPGDEYVDIVGVDLYPDQALTDQTVQFNLLNSIVNGHKMVALTECGNLIDPQSAKSNNALWSYFMQWYDMDSNGNPAFNNYMGPDQWITTVNADCVTSQDGLSSFK